MGKTTLESDSIQLQTLALKHPSAKDIPKADESNFIIPHPEVVRVEINNSEEGG